MIRLGLDRVRRAFSFLEHPEEAFPSVLVAGTNGKGSVSSLVEAAARAAGLRTGHYTSPHLADVRERVRVAGKKIPAADWKALSREVDDLSRRKRLGLTEFERQSLVAFRHFARSRVDLAVVEVGLGGRLDAVNALPLPELSVITSIGHDHRSWLGPTLKHVYREKRGVARAGAPLVQSAPRALWAEGDRHYKELGVPAWTLDREVRIRSVSVDWARRLQSLDVALPGAVYRELEVGLLGAHQARNAALAVAACHHLRRRGWPIKEEHVRRGFRRASWPGRFQVLPYKRGGTVILDGAHNKEAAEALAAAYKASPWGRAKAAVIFGCLKDKDAAAMVRALKPVAREVILVPLPTPRSRAPEDLLPLWKGVPAVVAADIQHAWGLASGSLVTPAKAGVQNLKPRIPASAGTTGGTILVTGSLYLVGEVLKRLGKVPS